MFTPARFTVIMFAVIGLVGCNLRLDGGDKPWEDAASIVFVARTDAGAERDADASSGEAPDASEKQDAGEERDGEVAQPTEDGASPDAAMAVCTLCHGSENPAPPVDLGRHTDTTFPGVGAHQTHVRGTPRSRPVPCSECHIVPQNVFDPGHLDGPRPAPVTFSGAAIALGAEPVYADGACRNVACHGGRGATQNASGAANPLPQWTKVDGTQAPCGACHSLPPPPPHPTGPLVCAGCHKDVAEDLSFVRPERHVDGLVTFTLPP